MAMINFNQVKGGSQLLTDVEGKLDQSAVVGESSETPADDKVLSEKAMEAKVVQLKDSMVEHMEETVEVTDTVSEITLSKTPADEKVRLVVNGITYAEGDGVTVDRATRKLVWTGEFPLTASTVDSAQVMYTTMDNGSVVRSHVVGMVLAEEGGGAGTWVRVNQNFETMEFDPEHGTWAGMHTVNNDTYGEFVEIPVTYVKTETLTDGPYAGCNCWWTADGQVNGFHVHPAFIGQDGQPHPLQIASWIISNKGGTKNEDFEWQGGTPFSEDKGNDISGYWNDISYNDVHAKGWMTDNVRPYNIYDHHFLARLMLTEFGTPDVQSQTVDGIAWTGANRIVYHGIHDLFGLPDMTEYYWLDGLTMVKGTYQVLAADGSLSMVETNISCANNALVWPVNCRVDKTNGIDFGDLFIPNEINNDENSGSFADAHAIVYGRAANVSWSTSSTHGAFGLNCYSLKFSDDFLGWRISRCAD